MEGEALKEAPEIAAAKEASGALPISAESHFTATVMCLSLVHPKPVDVRRC